MDEKASARTALVSKLWYRTWLTRPNLAFDGDKLQDSFSEYTKKTMQMYEDLNLTIESFRLRIRDDRRHHFHAEKLIAKAMNLGAFDLDINFKNRSMVLTKNILQSETLARLSLSESRVYLKRKKEVIHSKLKSLNLSRVTSQVDLFRDLILRCPLIEELKLDNIKGSTIVRVEEVNWSRIRSLNLSKVFVNGNIFRELIWRCPLLEELTLDKIKTSFGSKCLFYDSTISMNEFEFHRLKYLHLGCLNMKDTLRRYDFWAKFPHLKELVIISDRYKDYKCVRICSQSLELVTTHVLTDDRIMTAEFDVPNIRKFKFKGSRLPLIDFQRTAGEWESDIHVKRSRSWLNDSWFSSLNNLVKTLSGSKLSLSVNVKNPPEKKHRYVGGGSPIPRVEKLRLKGYAIKP